MQMFVKYLTCTNFFNLFMYTHSSLIFKENLSLHNNRVKRSWMASAGARTIWGLYKWTIWGSGGCAPNGVQEQSSWSGGRGPPKLTEFNPEFCTWKFDCVITQIKAYFLILLLGRFFNQMQHSLFSLFCCWTSITRRCCNNFC